MKDSNDNDQVGKLAKLVDELLCKHITDVATTKFQVQPAAGHPKPRQRSTDLVRLFTEANGLFKYFCRHVDNLTAGVSGFKITHPSGLKKHERAIEKTYRSYSGNPSMLLDLVRSSITCETLEGVITITENIRDDPCIRILQIKNRFNPHYDSAQSAGFRNLSFSIIIGNHTTALAKLDHHVCELQVGLKIMDDIKHMKGDRGHDMYKKWRDKMAE